MEDMKNELEEESEIHRKGQMHHFHRLASAACFVRILDISQMLMPIFTAVSIQCGRARMSVGSLRPGTSTSPAFLKWST